MKLHEIETPALIIEKSAFERNRDVMAALLAKTPMTLYPHYKSHKCPAIAKLQMEWGAGGITCAKLSEAKDLADAGIGKIVLANQVVQREKLAKVAALANRCDFTLCADCKENVDDLEAAMAEAGGQLRVLVEFEVGMRRCGVDTKEEFLDLARYIDSKPHLIFEGIQAYAGHISHEVDTDARQKELARIEHTVRELKAYVEEKGLPVANVCGGSTGFAAEKPGDTVYTQLQTGSYLFSDATYETLEQPFRPSLYLLTTVISAKADRTVVDAGVKSLTMDQDLPAFPDFPDAQLNFSEEHTALYGVSLPLGSKVRIIPGHCCTTVNVHDKLYLVDGDEVVDVWPVTSRGKAQ